MSTATIKRSLFPTALTELQTACLRVQPPMSADRLWNRHLTEADHQQLGGDFKAAYLRLGTVGLWVELRGVTPERALVEVARKIGFLDDENAKWLLRELGEFFDDPEQMLQAAIAAGGLVLIESPRTAVWNGNKIDVDWDANPKLWEFLWELCISSKRDRSIDYMTFGRSMTRQGLTDRKSRLAHLLPRNLRQRIKTSGRSSYTLDLARDRIRLFIVDQHETLTEVSLSFRIWSIRLLQRCRVDQARAQVREMFSTEKCAAWAEVGDPQLSMSSFPRRNLWASDAASSTFLQLMAHPETVLPVRQQIEVYLHSML